MASTMNKAVKVVVFAGNHFCGPVIEMLVQQQLLAGVVLPQEPNAFTSQLAQALAQSQLPMMQFDPLQISALHNTINSWEANIGLSFGFEGQLNGLLAQMSASNSVDMFAYQTGEAKFAGDYSIYWQVRQQVKATSARWLKLTLQQPSAVYQMANEVDFNIHPMDTTGCVENALLQQIAGFCYQFLHLFSQGSLDLAPAFNQDVQRLSLKDDDLRVDWRSMNGEQICALARAGNPHFGGCVITINNTDINLQQASVVDYPTYGVDAGMICATSESDGVIVATLDGAIALDILSNVDGLFSGARFCERFGIHAGMAFK